MGKKYFRTRLISIVSNPIEVVVVVIVVVVFVKRIGPKMFDKKKIPCPKTLGLKVLDQKVQKN